MWFRIALFVIVVLCARSEAEPSYIHFPSDIRWMRRDSPHFRILYREGETRLAERTLIAAERAHKLLSPVFEDLPSYTWIVLADFHDSLNGYAIDFPFPHMVVFASPPEPSGHLAALDDWLESLVLHEYVHVLHLYPATSYWSVLRSIFGAWVLPNGLMPSHLHEGLATFLETQYSEGGRGRGSAFPMIVRMAVKEGAWGKDFVPLDLIEGSSVRWPQGSSPYFFGYYLYEELWNRKKEAGIRTFVRRTSRAFPYLINGPVQDVYGSDYPSLWKDIFRKTGERARNQIQEIERKPLSELRYLSQTGFHKWDLVASPKGDRLAYRRHHPETGSVLEILGTQKSIEGKPIELEPGQQEGICWVERNGREYLIFAETDESYGYELNSVVVLDLADRRKTSPSHASSSIQHVHSLACSSDGRALTFQESSGHGRVREWKTDAKWKKWEQVREWAVPEGAWVTSLFIDDSPILAVRHGKETALYRWASDSAPRKIWDLPGHFHHFSRTSTGEWLAVGNLSGRDEVFALHPERKTIVKRVAVLGGINSFAQHKDKLWVSSYRHGGYDVAEAKPVETARDAPPTPGSRPKENVTVSIEGRPERPYNAWPTLAPRAWIPSMLVVPDGVQFSAWIPGFDISQRHVYDVFGGYDTRGSLFLIADYLYRFGSSQQFNVNMNYLPSYLISSRDFLRQWGTSIGYSTKLGADWPRLSLSMIFRRVESSRLGPANQSVGFGVGLSHTMWKKTIPRGIAPRRATQISLYHSQFFQGLGSMDNYFYSTAGLDQYFSPPWFRRHVVKLGLRFGLTEGTPLYNSFFQGGGELIFSSGRGFFLNRGFLPGTFASQKMMAINLDYMFPIVEVERGWSQWPVFLKRIDGALVADTLTQNRFMYYYGSVGVELKSYWKLFYYIPTVIRFGGYHGFGAAGEPFYFTTAIEATL